MTFPLMSAGVLRLASTRPGHVLALLYFANSLGAAVGVLVAGFYLIAVAGLPGTLLAAGSINLGVALATFLGVRLIRPSQGLAYTAAPSSAPSSVPASAPAAPDAPAIGLERLWRLLLFVSFATAVASFIYEISWIRMLSLVLGSATHSFELMLSAFILGLALGALWSHRRADRFADPLRALGVVQWLMGFAALATLPVYLASFHWTASLLGRSSGRSRGT
jgi:predicted membrane-bound spermidine synthase